ncbi:MAG: hypothetical protein WKF96_22770 [Solirubrobacteraceae bacterium]
MAALTCRANASTEAHGIVAHAGSVIVEAAGFAALIPAPRAAVGELEVLARTTMRPDRPGHAVDQCEQAGLGGRVDAARNRATQSQRPFPSASINRTPISLQRLRQARDLRTRVGELGVHAGGLDARPRRRQRVQRALLGDQAQLHHRRPVDAGAVGGLADRALASQQPEPDLILL